jgi:hypothetical protein
MVSLSKRQSFPRKRESTPSRAHFRKFADWIPANDGDLQRPFFANGASTLQLDDRNIKRQLR